MKLTIFTPTYNRAATLPRLYESLKAQNSVEFEWLVVDDGSTDHTAELLQRFMAEAEVEVWSRNLFFQSIMKSMNL